MSSQPMILNAMQNIIQRRRQDRAAGAQQDNQAKQMAHEERMQGQRIGASQQAQGMGMAENAVQAMEARDLMKQQVAQRQAAEAAQRQHEMQRDLEAGKQRMQEQFTRNDFETKQTGVKMGHEKELAEMDDSRAFMERRARTELQGANLAHEASEGGKSRWNAREIAKGHDDTKIDVEGLRQKNKIDLIIQSALGRGQDPAEALDAKIIAGEKSEAILYNPRLRAEVDTMVARRDELLKKGYGKGRGPANGAASARVSTETPTNLADPRKHPDAQIDDETGHIWAPIGPGGKLVDVGPAE